MKDFTLSQYMHLIGDLYERIGPIYGVLKWHQEKPASGILIRHDVDRKPLNALKMAQAEAEKGFHTTYYFRVVGSAFNPKIIKEISVMGHEIGYHYEDLCLAKGDVEQAHELFKRHLGWLRELTDIETIAMHGSPLSRHNNIDMWKKGSLAEYHLKADAFLDIDYGGMPYFTDTGRSWSAGGTNLRDKPASAKTPAAGIDSSGALVAFVGRTKPPCLALSAHPERWAISASDWGLQLLKDNFINTAKIMLRLLR